MPTISDIAKSSTITFIPRIENVIPKIIAMVLCKPIRARLTPTIRHQIWDSGSDSNAKRGG